MFRMTTALLATLVLAGCGSPDEEKATPSMAADGTDVRACYDLDCEIFVSSPVTFPIDARFGPDEMSVSAVGPDTVTVKATGDGLTLDAVIDRKVSGTLNGIKVRAVKVGKGAAVLRISPP